MLYLVIAIAVGGLFARFQVPAGWLLGALMTGIISAFYVKKLMFPDRLFKISLAIIGGNIGFMVVPEQFLTYHVLLLPFFITLVFTLIGAVLLGRFMRRFTGVHSNTAFFCCLPGGASEVIAISKDYGADQRIVAAFHTARITLFVLMIPFIVGLNVSLPSQPLTELSLEFREGMVAFLCLAVIVMLTIWLGTRIPLPGAALFFAIALGFITHQWVVPAVEMPTFLTGMAQALMGAIIGMRFDRETFMELRKIGAVSMMTLLLYFIMSFALAFIFYLLTPLEFFTSLLSIVPAGAAEMASTATALQVEPTLVATLQMLRILTLFLLLPFLIKWFTVKNESNKPSPDKGYKGSH